MINEHACSRSWRRHVLLLATPVMISNSTVPLVGIVDTAVMGRMGAPEWVAATAVGAVIFSSIYWVFGFLRMATGGLVAQALGSGQLMEPGQTSLRALLLALVFGIGLWVLQEPLLRLGLSAMQPNPQWQSLTEAYFRIRILSAPATLANYAIVGTLVGLQRMRTVLVLQLLLNLLNIALNISFFRLTNWDIAGVALATVISEYITVVAGLWVLRLHLLSAFQHGHTRVWLLDRQALVRYFGISRDLFIRTLCLTFAFYWMTVLSSRLGVLVMAANAVLLHMVHFASYCMDGFSDATESLVGFAVGRRNTALLRKAVRAAMELGACAAFVFAAIYALTGPAIIDLMVTDELSRQSAAAWLPWVIIAPLIGIWSFILDGIFIGATQTASMRNGMLISLLAFLTCAAISVPVLGNNGLWLAYYVLMISRALTLLIAWPRVLAATRIHVQNHVKNHVQNSN